MPKGLSLHIGLRFVDAGFHGENFTAPGCDNAAVKMGEIAANLGFTNPLVLTNEEATIENVTTKLNSLVAKLEPDDLLLITLAGHCMPREDEGDCEEDKNQMFLLFNHRWIDDEIYATLDAIKVRARIMIVANACHSGSVFLVDGTLGGQVNDPCTPNAVTADDGLDLEFLMFGRLDAEAVFACRPLVTANVLLLASSERRTASSSIAAGDLPAFTRALVGALPSSTSYEDLRAKMDPQLPELARPVVLNRRLLTDAAFADQVPFRI